MNIIKQGYLQYRLEGGDVDFDTWFNCLLEKAYELDEIAVYEEINEDFNEMDNYYTNLCEEITLKVKKEKKRDKKLNSEELKAKYEKYVKKRKKQGKEVLPFNQWVETQNLVNELKGTMAKAGIATLGATAVAVGKATADITASKIRKKGGITTTKKQDAKSKESRINFEGKKRRFNITARTEYK